MTQDGPGTLSPEACFGNIRKILFLLELLSWKSVYLELQGRGVERACLRGKPCQRETELIDREGERPTPHDFAWLLDQAFPETHYTWIFQLHEPVQSFFALKSLCLIFLPFSISKIGLTGIVLTIPCVLLPLIQWEYWHGAHYADEGTEAQRDLLYSRRCHSWYVAELGLDLRHFDSRHLDRFALW